MQILTLCINRNIVEYKDFLKNGGCYMGKSINRNIVECKDKFKQLLPELLLCINRNIVECKDGYFGLVCLLADGY